VTFVFAFLASLLYIYLKATQQLQVVAFEFRPILPTSIGMACCEVFIMSNVVRHLDSLAGLALLAACIGTGSGIGCLIAMKRRLDAKVRADARLRAGMVDLLGAR
jgi:hypothetical protein